MLRIRLQAQPIEGRANEELVRVLARLLGLSKSSVQVIHGLGSRHKVVELQCPEGSDAHSIKQVLLGLVG